MKKNLLSGLLLASSFLLFNNDVSAAEQSTSTGQLSEESTENIVYFDMDKQDILVTDDVIIRKIGPSSNSLLNTLSLNQDISLLGNGVWDLLGYETVYSQSSIWHSDGGDFKVVIDQTDFGPVFYQLKEEDTYTSQSVGSQQLVSGTGVVEIVYRNITSYVDGDNNLAEFYMTKLTHKSNGYLMAFYD
ncbi:hypothetical protein ACIQXF_14770 [Lysinibacillus sp. NPDC097231]|uniref:hypothetical protein n=1 Tax=Lysinibacillus sp. NPDC097231 TaxID=3364142 RepID=UPI00381CE442